MTTTLTLHVGGAYVAEVKGMGAGGQHILETVQGGTSKNIPVGGHPAHTTLTINEREMNEAEKIEYREREEEQRAKGLPRDPC